MRQGPIFLYFFLFISDIGSKPTEITEINAKDVSHITL